MCAKKIWDCWIDVVLSLTIFIAMHKFYPSSIFFSDYLNSPTLLKNLNIN